MYPQPIPFLGPFRQPPSDQKQAIQPQPSYHAVIFRSRLARWQPQWTNENISSQLAAVVLLAWTTLGWCAPTDQVSIALSLASIGLPLGLNQADTCLQQLEKRDMCTVVGWLTNYEDVFGLGSVTTDSGFYLYYVGGVLIGASQFNHGGSNPIAMGGVTIPAKELNTAQDIKGCISTWYPLGISEGDRGS